VPNCQKYTLTDCFFGEFFHWEVTDSIRDQLNILKK